MDGHTQTNRFTKKAERYSYEHSVPDNIDSRYIAVIYDTIVNTAQQL